MDPLSDVLSLLKPKNYLSAGFEAGGEWSIQFPDQQQGIKTGAIVTGECWLMVEGVGDAVRLGAGDCFLLPSGRPFRMATDLDLPPAQASDIFSRPRTGGVVSLDGGKAFSIVSNRFALAGEHAVILLRMLPPIVVIRAEAGRDTLRWAVETMMRELRAGEPGSFLVVQHLAHMMLVEALRLHLTQAPGHNVGWLFALGDKQIGAAISAMHAEPATNWTLQSLAEQACMSRSSFALKFKGAVGSSPMEYLTRWRMIVAGDRLMNSTSPVSTIALSLGYESESAFSTAFKRVMGCSPRQYGRSKPHMERLEAAE